MPYTALGHGHHHNHRHEGHEDQDKHANHVDHNIVHLSKMGVETSNIATELASLGELRLSINVNGYVVPNEYQTTQIRPRYPGFVKSVFVQLGQKIKKNRLLAVIQANGSETNYNVTSSLPGTITKKNIIQGQFIGLDQVMFTVSNLNRVWAHLNIPESSVAEVKIGQEASILNWTATHTYSGKISYISPKIYKDSQSIMVRIEIADQDRIWRPGMFLKAQIDIKTIKNVLLVKKSSIHTIGEKRVIFVEKKDGIFVPKPIKIGRNNDIFAEILSGLREGERYAAKNSYFLKAELLKSEASHEH